jgi:hypothetical protein
MREARKSWMIILFDAATVRFVQIDDGFGGDFGSTTDTFGQDETYFEFGPNYALTQRNNFFEGGMDVTYFVSTKNK